MTIKLVRDIDKETKRCNEVFAGDDTAWALSQGFFEQDVEQAYTNDWYLVGYAPEKPAPTHEDIRFERQARYTAEADPLRYDYDEALARGEPTAEEKKQAWLDKKDEIRAELPYPDEEE